MEGDMDTDLETRQVPEIPVSEERCNPLLRCDKCREDHRHIFVGTEHRDHTFPACAASMTLVNLQYRVLDASGEKEIWECDRCGTTRIWGAVGEFVVKYVEERKGKKKEQG